MSKTTFIMLKPDALKAHLENDILKIFSDAGIRVIRTQTKTVDEKLILNHYQEVIERLNLPDFPNRIKKEFVGHEVKIYEL
ncbi:MAG: nucleoside-diphosphate kinase, partial [Erysipelotrichaceae bacterium]